LQNVIKDYIIFSYFRNFVAKTDQKPKTKNEMNKTNIFATDASHAIAALVKIQKVVNKKPLSFSEKVSKEFQILEFPLPAI
jgi:hypothetical protein